MHESKPKKNAKAAKVKIIFVCTGNTCRSPMAEAILKAQLKRSGQSDQFAVSSAGLHAAVGEDMSAGAKAALKHMGYPVRKHKARLFRPEIPRKNTLIVCMTAGHKARIGGEHVYTVAELTGGADVGDPFGADTDVYVSVARYLEYAMDDIMRCAMRQIVTSIN